MNKGIKVTVGIIIGLCLLLASASYASAQGALDQPQSQIKLNTAKLNVQTKTKSLKKPAVVAMNTKPVVTKTVITKTVITKTTTPKNIRTKNIQPKKVANRTTKKPMTIAAISPSTSTSAQKIQTGSELSNSKINSTTTIKKTKVVAEKPAKWTGQVNFTYGSNNDIDDDKLGFKDNFYQISPQLNFEGDIFSGSFGAAIMDWQKQEISNIAKKTTADVDLNMTLPLSNSIKSKTKVLFGYNDEKNPDLIDDNEDGMMDGMPIRYVQYGIKQTFAGKFDNNLILDIGGGYKRRDYSNLYSDMANDLLEEYRYEQDHNEGEAFGRIGYQFNSNATWTMSPSVKHKKYDNREGRQTDGTWGGQAIRAPKYETITTQLATQLDLKIAALEISPMGKIGQVSDEALGAENQDFYGAGISGAITVWKAANLKLSGSYEWVKRNYDNWTKKVESEGDTRVNEDTETVVALSSDLTKNMALKFQYKQITEESNLIESPDHNFRQEIIGTTLSVMF